MTPDPMPHDLMSLVPNEARYTRCEIPAELNAMSAWTEALRHMRDFGDQDRVCSALVYGTEDGRSAETPSADELARVKRLLDANQRAFDLIDEGIRLGRVQLPAVSSADETQRAVADLIDGWHRLGRLRTIRYQILLHDGDADTAAIEAARILRFGEMICQGEGLVMDYLAGHWLRGAGIRAIRRLATESRLADETLQRLLVYVEQSQAHDDGLIESERIELCCYTLPRLDILPEDGDTESLVDKLLQLYYDSVMMGDLMPDCDSDRKISDAVRQRRIADRRNQLISLLEGHPRPYDKVATVRLAARRTTGYIAWLRLLRQSRLWRLHDRWRGLTSRVSRRPQRRAERIWPPLLLPGWPFEFVGDDEQAAAQRAELASLGWQQRHVPKPPSKDELAAASSRLQRIENPVGLVLQPSLHAPEAASRCALECWRDLELAKRVIRKELGR